MIEKFDYHYSNIFRLFHPELGNADIIGNSLRFEWITNSSREVKPNSLFIPLKAERDGHLFIEDAIQKGAIGFLYTKGNKHFRNLPKDIQAKGIPVDDTWTGLGILGHFHRSRFNPFVIGITGSSGKTTTKEFLGKIFNHWGSSSIVVTEGNFNNEIGVPFTLFRINEKTKVVILEMGMNHRGEIAKLTKIAKPNWAVITTIGSAHIENLKSPMEIAREKTDILLGLPKRGKLFYRGQKEFSKLVTSRAKTLEIDWVDLQKYKSKLKIINTQANGFHLDFQGENFFWKFPGQKLLENLDLALAIGEAFSIPKSEMIARITRYTPAKGRLEIRKKKFFVIDDTYNANPESMESSILTTKQIADGKKFICILGDMKELGEYSKYYHQKISKLLEKLQPSLVISFGKDSKWYTNSLRLKAENSIFHFTNSEDSIMKIRDLILTRAGNRDPILVKGSRSMKMERIIEKILEA